MNATPIQYRISPEFVAYKFAALRNFLTPNFAAQVKQDARWLQVPWVLESEFRQPGGSARFIQGFVETFADRIGTASMHRLGQRTLTDAEREEILDGMPRGCRETDSPAWRVVDEFFEAGYDRRTPSGRAAAEFFDSVQDSAAGNVEARPRSAFKKLDLAALRALCVKVALVDLPWRLTQFCSLPDEVESLVERHWRDDERRDGEGEDRPLKDVWYFRDLPGAMLEYLDVYAARTSKQMADTTVSAKVFKAMQFAREENCAIIIHGQSRFGKTHAVATYCEMRPGVARLVRTPCSNSMFDFLQAIAEAFGLEVLPGMTRRELQRKVQFLIRHGGLFLVFDEFHYAFPRSVLRNTEPTRLNFIREHIMDRNCPMVLVSTPQEYSHSLNRFTKTTHHNIQQFAMRIAKTVTLPETQSEADLLNVARHHFPTLRDDDLEVIVGAALATGTFLPTVVNLAKQVRFFVRDAGRDVPTSDDLKLAISEVIGPAPASDVPLLTT